MIEKSPEAFRTISEVAEELDLPQHVLRFWETRFAQIKPMKRGGGRRYYRPEDTNLLKGIRFLLYGEGYTIKGVQRILKEQGVRHVASVWQEMEEESGDTSAPVQQVAQSPAQAEPAARVETQSPAPRLPDPEVPQQVSPQLAAPPAAEPAPAPPAAAPVAVPQSAVAASRTGLSSDDVRQLKAALFELIECKRMLDTTTQAGAV
jgi:DNA-binding transcriptional MerR regulator